ncbi:MAG TPA: Gfo/Idh/MocA family oxidoreductase [Solirubrobacteraceae bacterium]|nr:Gfo/Idh/MocA family oxidoreductase [Solirubrobacteraceae bacterium]
MLGLGSAGRRHASDLVAMGHEVCAFDPRALSPAAGRTIDAGADVEASGTGDAGAQVEVDGAVELARSFQQAIEGAAAVVVASPSALHAGQAAAALEAGCHVLVEKPLATNLEDARRVVALGQRTGVTGAVGMNLRFHSAVVALRRLVEGGTLGELYYAQASYGQDLRRWRPGTDYRDSYSARSELGGGIVLDAIHELDYLLWLLGPVATVAAEADHLSALEVDVEDIAVVVARFAAGALATIDLNFLEPGFRRRCLLVGSEAVAECDLATGALVLRRSDGESEEIDARCDPRDTYRAELVDFIDAIERRREPRCPLADGAAGVAFAEAIKESALGGLRVVLT